MNGDVILSVKCRGPEEYGIGPDGYRIDSKIYYGRILSITRSGSVVTIRYYESFCQDEFTIDTYWFVDDEAAERAIDSAVGPLSGTNQYTDDSPPTATDGDDEVIDQGMRPQASDRYEKPFNQVDQYMSEILHQLSVTPKTRDQLMADVIDKVPRSEFGPAFAECVQMKYIERFSTTGGLEAFVSGQLERYVLADRGRAILSSSRC